MIPCPPVEWRQPAEPPAEFKPQLAPANAPGYANQLKPSRWGWVAQKRWCLWVEPGQQSDRWNQRWQSAVNSALLTWGEHVKLIRVSDPKDAQLRLWRRRPPLKNGRASNGRALLKLQQVQRQGQSTPALEPLVEVLISPGQRQAAIQATALHELGHGFGLWGHSELSSDVMGAVPGAKPALELSERDQQTLQWLFEQPSALPAAPSQTAAPEPAPPSDLTAD